MSRQGQSWQEETQLSEQSVDGRSGNPRELRALRLFVRNTLVSEGQHFCGLARKRHMMFSTRHLRLEASIDRQSVGKYELSGVTGRD